MKGADTSGVAQYKEAQYVELYAASGIAIAGVVDLYQDSTDLISVKELADIRAKGTPAGIELLQADNMAEWLFSIRVLGDETVYRVSLAAALACGGMAV